MMKHRLLNQLYGDSEYDQLTISDFTTLAYLYNVDVECYVETPIYSYKITKDICSELNRIYNMMTCRNLYSGKLTFKELNDKFNEVKAMVVIK